MNNLAKLIVTSFVVFIIPAIVVAQASSKDPQEAQHVAMSPNRVRDLISKRLGDASTLKGEINSIGLPSAKLKLFLFQDLGCGMCKRWILRAYPTIKDRYVNSGRMQLYFMEFPLISNSKDEKFAAAAKCAGEQGKYVPFVMKLYEDMKNSSMDQLAEYAKETGVNINALNSCLADKRYEKAVSRDRLLGTELVVRGVPTFFLNGREILGAVDVDEMIRIVEEELQKGE